MSRNSMNVVKGVASGIIVGGVAGIALASAMRPKKSKIKKAAARTLDTVGSIMQNVADYTR